MRASILQLESNKIVLPSVRLVPAQRTISNANFQVPELVSFRSTDDKYTIYSQLFRPPANMTPPSAGFPAVVFTHGGSQRQMYLAFHYSLMYAQLYAGNQYLASQGYVVLSVNYRSGVGYGHLFRCCPGCNWINSTEYSDVRQAGLWLAAQSQVSSTK